MRPRTTLLPASLVGAGLLLSMSSAYALDAGVIGPTYEIAEPHLLQFIEARLRQKEASGELRRLQEEARKRGVDSVRHPEPVAGLSVTQAKHSFYYDPTYTLDRNIQDAQGRLMFAAGTRANPLLTQTCPDLKLNKYGNIVVDQDLMSSLPGVFAGGDIVRGAATVILAMGDGKTAAKRIDAWLKR